MRNDIQRYKITFDYLKLTFPNTLLSYHLERVSPLPTKPDSADCPFILMVSKVSLGKT
jgi:hypothetical protein